MDIGPYAHSYAQPLSEQATVPPLARAPYVRPAATRVQQVVHLREPRQAAARLALPLLHRRGGPGALREVGTLACRDDDGHRADHRRGACSYARAPGATSARIRSQACRASSTDPSSSIVVMSPGSRSRTTAFSTRRMILPLRVFGSMPTKWRSATTAIG